MTRSYRLLPAFALALGLGALGCGGTPTTSGEQPEPPPPPAPPKVEVRGPSDIDAGPADFARPKEFTFTVANTGGAPLQLTVAARSCSCADVEAPAAIDPGKEGKVVIRWSPAPGFTGAYSLTTDLTTNDPGKKKLHFSVSALIQPLVRVFIDGKETNPDGEFGLDFGDKPIDPGEVKTRDLIIFSTKVPKFDLRATCTVPGFDIPPPTRLPAGATVGDYADVLCGYKVEITSTKDVPLGYVRGQVELALSNLGDGEPDRTIPLPLVAVVGQGVVTVTPGLLMFGKPAISDEDTAKVNLTYIKPPAQESVKVKSVEPAFVTVDKPEQVRPGQWRITAHLPKNNPEAAKYQSDPPMIGKVVLEVAGLDRAVTIEVKWAPLPK